MLTQFFENLCSHIVLNKTEKVLHFSLYTSGDIRNLGNFFPSFNRYFSSFFFYKEKHLGNSNIMFI